MLRGAVQLLYRQGGDVKAICALNVRRFKEEGQWLGERRRLGTATFAGPLPRRPYALAPVLYCSTTFWVKFGGSGS